MFERNPLLYFYNRCGTFFQNLRINFRNVSLVTLLHWSSTDCCQMEGVTRLNV